MQGCLLDEGARDTINEGTNVSVVGAPTARGCLIEGGGALSIGDLSLRDSARLLD